MSARVFARALARALASALAIISLVGCARGSATRAPAPSSSVAAANAGAGATRRAIVVSFDAFNERRVVETIDSTRIPAIRALFREGACAASAQPHFPSVTAAGHASIWTGTYGATHGISANAHLRLPASQHTILETANGFTVEGLRAEPIWITAASAGLTVFGHHVTQAPGVPGYRTNDGEPADTFAAARARAVAALASERLGVLNGYNRTLFSMRLLTRRDVQLTEARGWGAWRATPGEVALEFSVPLSEEDPAARERRFHVLLRLWPAADTAQLFAAFERSLAQAVRVTPHAEEREPPRGRALARHFSAPLTLQLPTGERASMRLRLFSLSARDTSFTLFVPGVQLPEANRVDVNNAYDAANPGWVGNSAAWMWEAGLLGPTLAESGDGKAELRWLESAELLTRTFMEGAAWGWSTRKPRLMLDYFPLGDDTDHTLWGLVDPRVPAHDTLVARRAAAVRARLWELVDMRLTALMQLVRRTPGTRLFVTGDHGMRATWRLFRPNVALREAGLLAVDGAGRIDLSRTVAASPNGYWISVNRVGRRGGIVPADSVAAVKGAVRRALWAARDEWGRAVVTRVFDAADVGAEALGIGGAAGGDIYYEVADGLSWNAQATGSVVFDAKRPVGTHGYPSTAADMQTVFCQWMPGEGASHGAPARLTDVSPAVRRWLGVADR
ncbi:MAG: alkaline phosphatase family protein [Gemmatimonadaceae bacterium]|nr:alkaline phosphatase family protein [Gemmatimonadaceae bacterium]